jgi:hypothetical protein
VATVDSLYRRFETVFPEEQAQVLAAAIHDAYADLVKTSDFNELKEIVRNLAEAQGRMAEAQERTEEQISELTAVVADLVRSMNGLRREMGGLSRGFSYSLENEAYRMLPAYLQERYDITIQERIIRTEINGEEINFFARGQRNGDSICLVGESKIQIDERRENRRDAYGVLDQLERKANVVQDKYPDCVIVRLLVTHYARPSFLEMARSRDIIVVQSFEW